MNQHDGIKLLFGPYKAPALRKGDRTFCLLRDCDVIVTGWTDALIPWPRGRALETRSAALGRDEKLFFSDLAAALIRNSHDPIERGWEVIQTGKS